ncbi:MAG: GAF domain-containing protein [Bacteroidales bacterium]
MKAQYSLDQTTYNYRLLMTLSQATQSMQRVRTPEDVFRTIGDELINLGYHALIFTFNDDRSQLVLRHFTFDSALLQTAGKMTGQTPQNFCFPELPDDLFDQIIFKGHAYFYRQITEPMFEGVPGIEHSLTISITMMLGLEQIVYVGLHTGDEAMGLLVVIGQGMSEADIPAVNILANQAVAALESIRLYIKAEGQAKKLEQKVNELDALNTMAGIILESVDIREICRRALDESLTLIDVNAGILYMLDQVSGDMVMTAHRGLTNEFVQAVGRLKPGVGLAWHAANTRRPVIMSDISEYPGALKIFLEKEGIQSSVVIPLIGRTGIVGAMNLAAMKSRSFDTARVELLTVIGQQIAIGLEKARLHEALQNELIERKQAEEALIKSELIKSELLEKLDETQHIALIGSWEWYLLTNQVWWSEETYRICGITPQNFIPDSEANSKFVHPDDITRYCEAFGQSLKTGEPLDIDIRLITNDGLMKYCNKKGKVFYDNTGQPIRFVGTLMDITERKWMECLQETLYTISQAAVTTENLLDFYQSIHHTLSSLIPANNFYISLYDSGTDLISSPCFIDQKNLSSPPYKPGRGLIEYVLLSGKPLRANPQAFFQLVQQGKVDAVDIDWTDWLGVPLKLGTKVIGVMSVKSYTENIQFSYKETEILEYVSAQVTTAIEHKMAQQRIADALTFNNTLISASTLGISAYDSSGKCILANEAIVRIMNATHELVSEQNYNQIKSWQQSGLLESIHEAIATNHETRREIHINNSFGKEAWLDCRSTPFTSGGKPHLLLTFGDITIAKQAEEIQRKNAERAAMLAEISQSLAEVTEDPHDVLALITRRVTEIIGDVTIIHLMSNDDLYVDPVNIYQQAPSILEHLRELYASAHQNMNEGFAQLVMQTGQALMLPTVTKEQLQKSTNPNLWSQLAPYQVFALMIVPLRSQNHVMGLLTVMRLKPDNPYSTHDRDFLQDLADHTALALTNSHLISDLQTYTAKLERSNRDLQEFAYVASHDLQEPLRKILAFGDRLANKYQDVLDETGVDYLKRMQNASQRMQTLINDLLAFSRISSHAQPFAKIDMNELAQEVISDLENQIERTKGQMVIGNLPTIEADSTQMHQLLQNLIGNALKFNKDNISPIVQVSAHIKGNECQISVQDNGIGFDIQYLDRIFKPFQRLHNREEFEGSGMGLAICRRIVEHHNGKITATSEPGKGSTFIVSLPINQSKGKNSHA